MRKKKLKPFVRNFVETNLKKIERSVKISKGNDFSSSHNHRKTLIKKKERTEVADSFSHS